MNLRQHCFGHFRVPEINKPKSSGFAAAVIHFYLPSKVNQTKFINNNRELKHTCFWDGDGNRKRPFCMSGKPLSPRFLYYSSLMEKRYLAMWMWLCEGKLKVKISHFRLPPATQKCVFLSSLMARRYKANLMGYKRRRRIRLFTTKPVSRDWCYSDVLLLHWSPQQFSEHLLKDRFLNSDSSTRTRQLFWLVTRKIWEMTKPQRQDNPSWNKAC